MQIMLMFIVHIVSILGDDPVPTAWPPSFSIPFHETLAINGTVAAENDGYWYYDFASNPHVARFDHGKGQYNNFCMCGSNSTDECKIIFAADSWMYLHFPTLPSCCRLCNTSQGCGVLLPDWLTNGGAIYDGEFNISGKDCNTWHKEGAVATDYWSTTVTDLLPCQYHEIIIGKTAVYTHNLTMDATKYVVGRQDPTIFDVPDYCHQECPGKFGVTCG